MSLVWFPAFAVSWQGDLAAFTGVVVRTKDGDTVSISRDGEDVAVRLAGIDAPEWGQAFGRRAKQQLSLLADGRTASVSPIARDRYGRLVARVSVGEADLSEHMLLAGLAWHDPAYLDDPVFAALQRDAQRAGKGLWAVAGSQPPWEYREAQRRRDGSGNESEPVDREEVTQARDQPRSPDASSDIVYRGNVSSHVFHAPWCQHYNCKNCTRVFHSREEALRAGFRPGGSCRP